MRRPTRFREIARDVLHMGLLVATSAGLGAGGDLLAAQPETRRPILITVDDLHVKAVGLVIWKNVGEGKAGLDLLDLWLRRGHELGNHSFGHPDYSVTDEAAYIADVERGRKGLAGFLAARGATPRFFRFPYLDEGETGEKLDAMRRYLGASGQRSLPVTLDTQDWSFEEPWIAARRAGGPGARAEVAADYLAALRLEVRSQELTMAGSLLFPRPTAAPNTTNAAMDVPAAIQGQCRTYTRSS